MSGADTRTFEEIGRDWEMAGWKKQYGERDGIYYTKELSPSVMEKIKEGAKIRKRSQPSFCHRISHLLFGR